MQVLGQTGVILLGIFFGAGIAMFVMPLYCLCRHKAGLRAETPPTLALVDICQQYVHETSCDNVGRARKSTETWVDLQCRCFVFACHCIKNEQLLGR
jgi:hypothetical protein